MTFEEFLTKKKIDLAQFRTAEPGVFAEFQSHYEQMGAKSFDHSKKFLFNKLRRAYHLQEEPKPVAVKETVEINEIAAQAESLLSPTLEATVYTPRFKAPTASTAEPAADTSASANDKPAYKPRFKAPVPAGSEPGSDDSAPAEPTKPAFKPRFKAGLTSTPETKAEETKTESAAEEKPKPAYVPRFKAPAPAASAEPPTEDEIKDLAAPAVEAKPAYKPRFKATVTPAPDSPPTEASDPKIPTEEEEKQAYKPRFKPSMLKPKKDE